ncbi:MAG: serine/threonine protein kinase [Planctomycetes bacterium]|nr:serine/threonine protein kinase [Planctomycetota bacterium]
MITADDFFFAMIAIRQRYVSDEQATHALLTLARGETIESRLYSDSFIDKEQRDFIRRKLAGSKLLERSIFFGMYAVKAGMCSQSAVDKALELQTRRIKSSREYVGLDNILVEGDHLTTTQAKSINNTIETVIANIVTVISEEAPSKDELCFGRVALEKRFVTITQIDEALKLVGLSTKGRTLAEIFEKKGYVTANQIETIERLAKQRRVRVEGGGNPKKETVHLSIPKTPGTEMFESGLNLVQVEPLSPVEPLPEEEPFEAESDENDSNEDVLVLGAHVPDTRTIDRTDFDVPVDFDLGTPGNSSFDEEEDEAEEAEDDETEAEEQIPGYAILSKLGEGAMGSVYLAYDKKQGFNVAIKLLKLEASKDSSNAEKRFVREAKISIDFNHPNLVKGYHIGKIADSYFYTMELVDGETIDKIIRRKSAIEEKDSLHVIKSVLRALDYASQFKMVHRDIKPSNIILGKNRVVKLLDLGLAKCTDSESQQLTAPGMIMGTAHYMSPDIIRGAKDPDVRSDIYSLGATLFHMLTGVTMFKKKAYAELIRCHIHDDPPLARDVNQNVSEACSILVSNMLIKDRNKRYQTAKECLQDIDLIESGREVKDLARKKKSSFFGLRGKQGG